MTMSSGECEQEGRSVTAGQWRGQEEWSVTVSSGE